MPHDAVIAITNELRSSETFQKYLLKMCDVIQKETKLMELADIMARGCHFESDKESIKDITEDAA